MEGKQNEFLQLISKNEEIIIDACDGTHLFADAKETFKLGIHGDFKNWDINKPGKSTQKTAMQVHETAKGATFAQMFDSFGVDLDKLYLTQHQIKIFCEVHKNWLRTGGYGNFFLFKVDSQFFVARVYVESGELGVDVYLFEFSYVWNADNRHRVIVPKLPS